LGFVGFFFEGVFVVVGLFVFVGEVFCCFGAFGVVVSLQGGQNLHSPENQ